MATKMRASFGLTRNIGNFNSIKIEASVERDGDTIKWDDLWREVQEQVTMQISKLAPPAPLNDTPF